MVAPSNRSKKTAQLVLAAIADLAEVNGSSIQDICEYINLEYAVPEKDFKRYINKAIEKGVAFGAIKKTRGRFQIGDVLEKVTSHRRRRSRSRSRRRRRSRKGGRRRRRHQS